MKKILLLVLIFFSFTSLTLRSQRPISHQEFYQSEWNNFKDFVSVSSNKSVDSSFDIRFYHLQLDVSIDPSAKYIKGNVRCSFASNSDNLTHISLSLHNSLRIDSISGNSRGFVVTGDSISIALDKEYKLGESAGVRIWYQGIPRLAGGMKGLRYEVHNGSEPVIATLSTPYLAHYWYPCKDGPEDKADSVYFDITVPDTIINGNKVVAVSNGILENTTIQNGKFTYSWRHRYPIVPYYVMMAIANYSHYRQLYSDLNGESFPLDYYMFKENDSISKHGVAQIPEVMKFFSEKFGEYPFWKEKFAMSELGYYGAIENQTSIITNQMTSSWLWVSVHELAHTWFGNMITCKDWHHAWLNEGFATYAEALWEEHDAGTAAYHTYINNYAATMGGTLYLQNALDTFNIFQPIVYNKGAWVLHMLRGVLGDSVFFKCLKTYSTSPGFMYKNASTEDFKAICELVSGKNLTTFFNQWVYQQYYPIYHYNFEQDPVSHALYLRIDQAQDSIADYHKLFEMPLQVKIRDIAGKDTTITVLNNLKSQEYRINLTTTVSKIESAVRIDPDNWVIRKIFYKPLMPVSVEESISNVKVISLYPNPASERISIEFPTLSNEASYEIYDQIGRLAQQGTLTSSLTHLNTNILTNGVYMIKVGDNKEYKCVVFVKNQ
ncbi:MAG: T9SS type A sorting domain-containing protein [Ignavibacteria bacterium]|nr:T9SS type A sorting domain-containing protein [Ignavibacteria bacterium]